MLKTRIIPTLLFKDDSLVKGIKFASKRKIGTVMQSVRVYNMRGVDELIFVDIVAYRNNARPDFETVDELADECFMPLTVGGGVRSIEDIKGLLKVGADKVSIGSSAVFNPQIISLGSSKFGSQAIVVSIDVKKIGNEYEVFTHSGTKPTGIHPTDLAKKVEKLGAGEILLTSIDKDGTMQGYDVDLVKAITESVNIPVIASGGCGKYEDMLSVVKQGNASAVAASSIFQFTEQTPLEAKKYLKNKGINVRI